MARTFGVRAVGSDNKSFLEQNQNANPLVNQRDTIYSVNSIINREELQPATLSMDSEEAIDIEGQVPPTQIAAAPEVSQPTNPISKTITDPMKPTDKRDEYYSKKIAQIDKADADIESKRQARGALTIMETATGLMNAYFKDKAIVNQNNYNIVQANRQILSVKNQAAFQSVREQSKAQSRQASAKLDAVARGQSPTGDIASIAENNEEMFLAQNLMGIEISAMRSVLGLEQDIIQYEASSRISRYQRDAAMVGEITTGAIQLGAL